MAIPTVASQGEDKGTGTLQFTPSCTNESGEIVLAFMQCISTESFPSGVNDILNAANGWTQFTGSPWSGSTANKKVYAFWIRTVDHNNPSPFSGDAGTYQTIGWVVLRGCATSGDPIEALGNREWGSVGTTLTIPSITTLGPDRLVVGVSSITRDTTSDSFGSWTNSNLANPAATEQFDTVTNTGSGNVPGGIGGYVGGFASDADGGATGDTTVTLATASTCVEIYFAVKPPPGATHKDLSPALENDAPQTLTWHVRQHRTLTPVTENDQPQALSKTKTIHKTLTPVLESDTARTLTRSTNIPNRRFDSTNDYIETSIGACANVANGAFTYAALIRYNAYASQPPIVIGHFSGITGGGYMWLSNTNGKVSVIVVGAVTAPTLAVTPGDGWCIAVVTKEDGDGVYPRFHVFKNGSWSHEQATTTTSRNPTTATEIKFNKLATMELYGGMDLAVVGEWDTVLTDEQIETLDDDSSTQDWYDLGPVGLWDFGQSDVATPVIDLTGNGANQITRVGTEVNLDGPLDWDYIGQHKNLVPVLESDQAQPLSKTTRKSLTAALETDAAQILTKTQAIHKNLTAVLEGDHPQALSVTKTIYKSLTAALEADQPQALSAVKPIHKNLVAALEADQPQALSRTIQKTLTAAPESDAPQSLSITHIHYRTLEPVAEADQALSVSYTQAHTYAIIEALESDAAQTLSVTKTIFKSLVPVSETDTPQTLSAKHFRTLTSASEADAPQALSYVKPIHQSITAVPESETAEILSVEKPIHKSLTAALESSAAQALSFLKTIHKTLTAVPELDLAQALSIIHPIRRSLTPVDEIDTAQDLYFTQENIFYILPVEEVEEALALNRIQILRPDSDSVDGEWTNEIGGTELASHVSDQDYGTYIQSPASPSADACRLKLKSGLAPVEGARLLKFRVWRDQPGQTIDLIVSLREGGGDNLGGGTLVNQFTHQNITDAATVEDEVTGNITDYSNLYVELEASEV